MKIIITVKDEDATEELKAVGARDLLDFFLPKAGIKPTKVTIQETRNLDGAPFHYTDTAES